MESAITHIHESEHIPLKSIMHKAGVSPFWFAPRELANMFCTYLNPIYSFLITSVFVLTLQGNEIHLATM